MSWYAFSSLLFISFGLICFIAGFIGRMFSWCFVVRIAMGDVLPFLVGSMNLLEQDGVGDTTFDAIMVLNMKHNEDSKAILNTMMIY